MACHTALFPGDRRYNNANSRPGAARWESLVVGHMRTRLLVGDLYITVVPPELRAPPTLAHIHPMPQRRASHRAVTDTHWPGQVSGSSAPSESHETLEMSDWFVLDRRDLRRSVSWIDGGLGPDQGPEAGVVRIRHEAANGVDRLPCMFGSTSCDGCGATAADGAQVPPFDLKLLSEDFDPSPAKLQMRGAAQRQQACLCQQCRVALTVHGCLRSVGLSCVLMMPERALSRGPL